MRIRSEVVNATVGKAEHRESVAIEGQNQLNQIYDKGLLPIITRTADAEQAYNGLKDAESLRAERRALADQITMLNVATEQANVALSDLLNLFDDGRLRAPVFLGLREDKDPKQVVRGGPNVVLKPAAAQSLGLALHELATNAAKYGGLSSRSGHVDVLWSLQGGNLAIEWVETGGPQVKAPTAQGFGTQIIVVGIEKQLGGQVKFDWNASGLRCTLSIPKENMSIRDATGGPIPAVPQAVAAFQPISQNRIMIVEDEALVALALAESMAQLGFSVVGPLHNLSEAELAVAQGGVDGAILDVNLNGRLVYPLADMLIERKVPFIFITGYSADNIDARFAKVPVLQKPIEPDTLRRVFTMNGSADSFPPAHAVSAEQLPADYLPKAATG